MAMFFAGLAPQLREAFVDLWLSGMFACAVNERNLLGDNGHPGIGD